MKIINANAEYLDPTDMSPYMFMERIGRICYKSENNITDDSAVRFVKRLAENKHTAMLEHAHIIMESDTRTLSQIQQQLNHMISMNQQPVYLYDCVKFINISIINDDIGYISASFRTFLELLELTKRIEQPNQFDVIKYHHMETYAEVFGSISYDTMDIPDLNKTKIVTREEFINNIHALINDKSHADNIIKKHLTHSILFTCDRGVSHEFVRHRPASFAQESTRYCNYSKDKFGKEITFIRPVIWNDDALSKDTSKKLETQYEIWKNSCQFSEKHYFVLLDEGATPEIARDVLHTSVKTELVITATENEWAHILDLRYRGTTGQPHPQMKEVMEIAFPQLIEYSDNRLS